MRVTVIGAGVAGLACALELAERGVSVEVLERGARLGAAGCSWYAGGMLAPWCELESSGPLIAQLGAESIPWWQERFPGTVVNGTLVVAHGRDAPEVAQFAGRTGHFERVGAEAIAALEPDLAGSSALVGRRHVIDCTGLGARRELADLRGVKGEMLLLRLGELSLARPVRLLHPRIPVYVVPRAEGLFMVGATMIESDEDTRISARSMLELLSAAYALHPAFGEAEIAEIGTGVRAAFPDNLPRLRRRDGALYVNGLYRHGFLIAPALARRAAAVLLEGRHFPELMDEDSRQRRLA
ncbi:MAG: FAD-dependent oxidoreductase [Gammaproteobacteria bacterium]|nr:MAG: FAD-dependent oxidoreductase [Gammaproteobacteria bacterium]